MNKNSGICKNCEKKIYKVVLKTGDLWLHEANNSSICEWLDGHGISAEPEETE